MYDEVGPSGYDTWWMRPHIEASEERVLVTGQFRRPQDGLDPFVTIAYDQATGRRSWLVRRQRDPDAEAFAGDTALAPGGDVLFVAGRETWGAGENRTTAALVVAYDAATGSELWETVHDEGKDAHESFSAIAVSPDGSTVYTAGSSFPEQEDSHLIVAAFDAARGALRWSDAHDGPAGRYDRAEDVAVSRDGSRVFVAGVEDLLYYPAYRGDFVTIAYDVEEGLPGTRAWTSRYVGPDGVLDAPAALRVSPGGERVFVTGTRDQNAGLAEDSEDFVTVAYHADTGSQAWVSAFDGPGAGFDVAESLALAPAGDRVYVTGVATTRKADNPVVRFAVELAMTTVAYEASTGDEDWVALASAPGDLNWWGRDVAVSPDGAHVYVTGEGSRLSAGAFVGNSAILDTPVDYVTVAYGAAEGTQEWIGRFNSRTGGLAPERAGAIAVRPDGGRVFVAGYLADVTTGPNREDRDAALGTVAYDAR